MRLGRVKVLHLPDVQGEDRETNHLAEQTQLELDAIDPPGCRVWAMGLLHQQIKAGVGVTRAAAPIVSRPTCWLAVICCHVFDGAVLLLQFAGARTAP